MKPELRSLFAEKDRFDPLQLRYTRPSNIQEERSADGSEKWVYRDPTSYQEVDAGTVGALRYKRFWLYPSTETVDFFDTIVERQALIDAFPEYIEQGGGVRFMHEPDPIGHVFTGDYETREKGVYVGLSIPEYETRIFQKIRYRILTGASLGWFTQEVKWPDGPNDKIRFTKIKIAEITLCDTRATKGTEFQEERSTTQSDEDSLFRRIWNRVAGMLNRQPAGTLPAETQEDLMNPEIKDLLEEQRKTNTALGELTKAIERMAKPADPPAAPAPQPGPAPSAGTEKPIEQRIAEAVTAANAPLVAEITSLKTELTTVKRSISTDEPLSADQIDAQLTAAETAVEEARKAGPSENAKLSFIRHTAAGRALTLGDLATGGE